MMSLSKKELVQKLMSGGTLVHGVRHRGHRLHPTIRLLKRNVSFAEFPKADGWREHNGVHALTCLYAKAQRLAEKEGW